MKPDARLILLAQALRAFLYGFGSVLLGVSLARSGLSATMVGVIFAALLAGAALMSAAVGWWGDRLGRRPSYAWLFVLMGAAGAVFGLSDSPALLLLAALAGTVSTDVVESGPFTSIELAMIPNATETPAERNRLLGIYNAVATIAGSVGALAAGGPELLRRVLPGLPPDQRWFLLYPVIAVGGVIVATRLSPAVELGALRPKMTGPPLGPSRPLVLRLAGLFALDSFAGGFVVQSYLAYWFAGRYHASPSLLGLVFFAVGLLQSLSFLAAVRLAERIGLLRTMVFTHLPSNLLLAAVPLMPTMGSAIAALLARFALSQMDVPARQAYLVALVEPEERTAATGFTNTARNAVRPIAPAIAGAVFGGLTAGPFIVAGALKSLYDLTLYAVFKKVPLREEQG
ncbi:MAG: MFS transporter [Actinomycetota bacterium]